MKRIIMHWTAGNYYPTNFEKKFYHYLFDKDGNLHYGIYKPEDNSDCTDGKYAKHCGGGNTDSIGVALCAMGGYTSKDNIGYAPMTKIQLESMLAYCAALCIRYKINPRYCMTHYEFGMLYPKSSSHGKIDITYLPCYPNVKSEDVGDFLRQKIKWYILKFTNSVK